MQNRLCGIYKITSPSGKIYIGQSVSIKDRWQSHKERYLRYTSKLSSSFKKHGVENHLFEIIELCDISLLNEREDYWITKLNTFNSENGLNCRTGGDKYIMSEETKAKLRVFNTGKKHSEETKIKCSIASKKRVITDETRKKLSISAKGRKMSEENKLKMSLSNKAGITGMLGKKHKKETIEKMKSKTVSLEARNKTRNTMFGQKYSIERINKSSETQRRMHQQGLISIWNKGKKGNPQTRESIEKMLATKRLIKQEKLTMIF